MSSCEAVKVGEVCKQRSACTVALFWYPSQGVISTLKVSSPHAEIIVLAGFTMNKSAVSAEASAAPYWSS